MEGCPSHSDLKQIQDRIRYELNQEEKILKAELLALDWIYNLVRANIKRVRFFEVKRALKEGKADCLAYSQILKFVAEKFSLNIGIIEVIVDNAGRAVFHAANIFKPSQGRWRIIDLWYRSKDINHQRIGAMIKEGSEWKIKDIDKGEFSEAEDIAGLPFECINALSWYTYGNIFLNRGLWDEAIECYDHAIALYPQNVRFYFSRSIAYE